MDTRDTRRPIVAVDSNAIVSLLNHDDSLNQQASETLFSARKQGPVVICGVVYVELAAMPASSGFSVDSFLTTTGIQVDWATQEAIWREAARGARDWHMRKRGGTPLPRRVPADFLIGAHALVHGAELLTFDQRTFRAAFPKLKIYAA